MSEQPVSDLAAKIPKWDVADRMRKSLRTSGVGVQEMADYLQVARNTVSTWINGRMEPAPTTLRLWALKTGVPFTWLCHGDLPFFLPPTLGMWSPPLGQSPFFLGGRFGLTTHLPGAGGAASTRRCALRAADMAEAKIQ
jgi:transcriptional regulator with XRE-family HTH domain